MKYGITERLFWNVFSGGYKRELERTLHIGNSGEVMKRAKVKYREILAGVHSPRNRFVSNIILASMLGAIYLSLDEKPCAEQIIIFNREALMNNKIMLKSIISEKNYTAKGQQALADGAKRSKLDKNPYSWQYTYQAGKSQNEYTVFFTACGIFYLYKQLNIPEITPAMCRLDYDMAHANHSEFYREQTLFAGGEYCDCRYVHTPPSRRK